MRGAGLGVALLFATATTPAQTQAPDREAGEWQFAATLDGKPIGTHRFVVSGPPEARRVESRANLVVRLLGIPVYRYTHQAWERWQADCLRELSSTTDDDGKQQTVTRRYGPDCLMAYAYWNPRLVQQARLVDPQTGRVDAVRFERVADAPIDVRGQALPAQGWRLISDTQRITVWYASESGRWIALDAEARGGRRLSYRIAAENASP